jgi:hypothetical protein
MKMTIEIIKIDRVFAKSSFPMASINAKSKRLFLSVDAYGLLKQLYGMKEAEYVLLHKDTTNPNALYIKPVDAHIPFRRKLSKIKSNRFLEIKALLKALGWTFAGTTRLKVSVDKKNGMLRIDKEEAKSTKKKA